MSVNVRTTSRLRYARLSEIECVECWELPEYPEVEPSETDSLYTVARHDRIDLIASRFYGAADLWWVIALVNEMRLLPDDLVPNTNIRVPSPARVYNEILKTAGKKREGR